MSKCGHDLATCSPIPMISSELNRFLKGSGNVDLYGQFGYADSW
ncbi:MAG: hypothetical protein ACI8UP_005603 [Porticoccaceae bacterium]